MVPEEVWSTILVDANVSDDVIKDVDPSYYRQDVIHIVKVRELVYLSEDNCYRDGIFNLYGYMYSSRTQYQN